METEFGFVFFLETLGFLALHEDYAINSKHCENKDLFIFVFKMVYKSSFSVVVDMQHLIRKVFILNMRRYIH